ncbi:uncharacterized protein F12A10.7-like [Cimex lectularius]|uniref:CPR type cuticle protein n=1 Tax=Cimex lectularius TaxID=79782 RepID=A0A8I6SLB6_CIMLE|nr:uncharacterized protein F12A10.7-like [Cimex lectularius]
MFCQIAVVLCAVAYASAGSATSYTAVSRPHSDSYKYAIDHDHYGHWYGESHPHGAGGLGKGHGTYLLGGGHGVVAKGGYGAAYGYGHATSYQNHNQHHKSYGHDHYELKPVYGGVYSHYVVEDEDHDHYYKPTSYQNQNLYAYGYHGYGDEGYGDASYGDFGYGDHGYGDHSDDGYKFEDLEFDGLEGYYHGLY